MAKSKEETKKSLFSSIFGRKEKKKKTSPTKKGEQATKEETGISSQAIPFLDLIAKNSLSLPGMARDVNVLRQNIAKLVKLKGETTATKADKFFKTEEQRESELESARAKSKSPTNIKVGGETKTKEESGGGGLGGILDMLNPVKLIGGLISGIVGGFASLFSGGTILALLSKIFIPAMLIGGLINGIIDGIKVWKQTGSLVDTLIAVFGGFLKFITFGLFGEKELRESMDSALKLMMPLLLGVTETFDKVVTWMKNNVGFPGMKIPLSKANSVIPDFLIKKGVKLDDYTIPAYYPFKKNTGSTKDEKYTSSATSSLKDMSSKLDSGEGVFFDKAAKERLVEEPKRKEKEEKQRASQNELEKTVSKSPTPDPYSPINAEKNQESAKGFLSSKVGVNIDPSSSTGYTDQASGRAITEEEVRRKIIAVGGEPTKILQMAKGKSSSPAPVEKVTATPPIETGGNITGGGGGGGSSSGGGGGSASSPSSTPVKSAPSGSSISSDSSMVAEGQRMDAAADAGTIINAPSVNNTSGQKAPSGESVADAYNSSFIKSYLTV